MVPSKGEWQKLAQENGNLLREIAEDKPEWIPRIIALPQLNAVMLRRPDASLHRTERYSHN